MKVYSYNEIARVSYFRCICADLMPPLTFAGFTRYVSSQACDYHQINCSYLAIIYEGEMEYQERGGQPVKCKPGTLVFLPQHSTYCWRTLSPVSAFHCAHRDFSFSEYGELAFRLGSLRTSICAHQLSEEATRQFIEEMEDFEHRPYKNLLITASILKLCAGVFSFSGEEQQSLPIGNTDNNLLHTCICYMEKRLSETYPLTQLAQHVNISLRKLFLLFQENLKIAPLEYINKRKLVVAQKQLIAGRSEKEITQMLGFSSVSYFLRFFKLHTGTTPRNYVKKIVEKSSSTQK